MAVRAIMKPDVAELAAVDRERFLKTDPDFGVVAGVEWWTHTEPELLDYLTPSSSRPTGNGLVSIGSKGVDGGIVFVPCVGGVNVVAVIRKKEREEEIIGELFNTLDSKLNKAKKRRFAQVFVPDGDYDLLRVLQARQYAVELETDYLVDRRGNFHDAWKCTTMAPQLSRSAET